MKTLGKQITKQFFNTETGYADLVKFWSQKIQEGYKPSTVEFTAYAILRGKDYTKGFTPITNQVKLDNGQRADYALDLTILTFRYKGLPNLFGECSALVPNVGKIAFALINEDLSGEPYKESAIV